MKVFLLTVIMFVSTFSFAGTGHLKTCSQVSKVCVVYHNHTPVTTKAEARFELFLENTEGELPELVKVDLWMQMGTHGHGSSPLKVVQLAPGHFDVTKAYFVMKGAWQVRVKYKLGETSETLIVPVMAKE